MTFISYAQNYEDVTLMRAFGALERGVYVDVGAQDPVADSVTKAFYLRGWRGVNIEPIAAWHEKIVADRPEDTNLNVAVADKPGVLVLHELVGTGMTTSVEAFAQHYDTTEQTVRDVHVPCITLDDVWRDCGLSEVHFLKIDVEGAEGDVLRGIDLAIHRPWVIVLEATLPNSMIPCHEAWEGLLIDRGYLFVRFDGLNRWYVAQEHDAALRPPLSLPPNIFDGFVRAGDHEAARSAAEVVARSLADLAVADAQRANAVIEAGSARAAADEATRAAHEAAIETERARAEADRTRAEADRTRAEADRTRAEADRTLAEAESRIAALSAHVAVVEGALRQEQQAKSRDLKQAAQRLADVQHEMQALYASRSWRLTGFLRVGNAEFRKVLRPVVENLLGSIRKSDTIKAAIWKVASVSPRVEARLRRFAYSRPVTPGRADCATGPLAAIPSHATDHAATNRESPLALPPPALVDRHTIFFYVDHTVACPVNTGVQRVVRGLAEALVSYGGPLIFVKWDAGCNDLVRVNQADLKHLELWRGPVLDDAALQAYPAPQDQPVPLSIDARAAGAVLVVAEVPYINFHGRALTLDLVLAAKRRHLHTAFVYYDAIPLRRRDMALIAPTHTAYMQCLLLADSVIAISQWSRLDIEAFLTLHEGVTPLDRPSITAVALPGESRLSPRVTESGTIRRKMILSVGTIEKRKNHSTLIAAFERFVAARPDAGWTLKMIGNIAADMGEELKSAQERTPAITVLGNVSDDELHRHYEECDFTVFPSIEEGFGLPIVESLWYGRPCICADFGSMAEIGAGGGCLLVDTRDASTLEDAIEFMVDDPTIHDRLVEEATHRPLRTWNEYAASVRDQIFRADAPLARLGRIYYCIEHTASFPYNTGIQRVVRGLARALIEIGFEVVPVRWNNPEKRLIAASDDDVAHLEKWNGPIRSGWTRGEPADFKPADWLVMPEVTAYIGGPDLDALKAYSVRYRLRTAWVFHDAIPWKLRSIYNPTVASLHRKYMEDLNRFDLVLANSAFTRDDLKRFLAAQSFRTTGLEERVLACPLPGEFRESGRVTETKPPSDAGIVVLSVGSIEIRKNQLVLLKAFAVVSARVTTPLRLRLVGRCYLPELENELRRELATMPNVTWEDAASDSLLRSRYEESDFTVYPSLEEGFGIPILESLWHARPCICRDYGAMAEVAQGGGCLVVETRDVDALADAIERLVVDADLRSKLAQQAVERPFRTWAQYGRDFAQHLADERFVAVPRDRQDMEQLSLQHAGTVNLSARPLLSICITTYNRARWLEVNLRNLTRLIPTPLADVEILVCDNTSTDDTPDVVKPYVQRPDFRYHRNAENVGMLGNLAVTAFEARGQHVWIVGDDDLLKIGSVEKVLQILRSRPGIPLVYLNYAYTREDRAEGVGDLDHFLEHATPIVKPGPDRRGKVRELSTESENFFTAIYCLVFRRDHALRAYAQDTSGRPFSTMLTCIPTTNHVLRYMMEEDAIWVGSPLLVVNMNVSWIRFAPVWILERLPEMFDLAEKMGADPAAVDRWRIHNLPNVFKYFEEILTRDEIGNADLFSASRLVNRCKHLKLFRAQVPFLRKVYGDARLRGAVGTDQPVEEVFAAFEPAAE